MSADDPEMAGEPVPDMYRTSEFFGPDPLEFPPNIGELLSAVRRQPSSSPGPPYIHTFGRRAFPITRDDEGERDLIDRIDDLTTEVGKCWQCREPLPNRCASDDFCGPECQEGWHTARCEPLTAYIEAGHDFDEDEVRFNGPEPEVVHFANSWSSEPATTLVRFDTVQINTDNLFARDPTDTTYVFGHPTVPGAVGYRYYFDGCPEGSEDPQEAWTLAQRHRAALIENAARAEGSAGR